MTYIKQKSIIALVITVFLFMLVLSVPITGTEASENTVTIETVSGELGETVSVDITASTIEMAGFQFLIYYDPEYLEPKDEDLYIDDWNSTYNPDYGNDSITYMGWDQDGTNVTVNKMFKIDFEVIKEIGGTSEIYINPEDDFNEVFDEDIEEIEVTYVSGGITDNGDDPKPRSGSPDPCYIATAVYGSYDAPEVVTLRSFRDEVLKKSLPGQLFIKAYYALSPPVADYLAEAETLNSWVRNLLDGFVDIINSSSEG